MSERKPFRNFKTKEPSLPIEQKIEKFVLRNSRNGFFTRSSTLAQKFEISESKSWDIIGELLSSGLFESIHDERTGEMKLCETGKIYEIMDLERKRKKEKFRDSKKKKSKN
ncbi:MAG: hypothetical protein K5790_03325 [Nitrosopumilus sp.]|uniref:hypothetical protein n=1 Tax=Nitrosopumilus sp. TaxID=2024843 RepID=UPI00247EF63F|nr:hypothetical protein [Nitrosopumilus sp.]MCV0392309.1 hypothetical protein [Nitrosopumilus sp.]